MKSTRLRSPACILANPYHLKSVSPSETRSETVVFSSRPATILFFVVWVLLLVSFIFLLIDFNLISTIKLNYHNLYGVAYSDPISGMPNRFSCDTVIEKYYDEKLAGEHRLYYDRSFQSFRG